MSDRDVLAKFNSLLRAGLTLHQAESAGDIAALTPAFAGHYALFKRLVEQTGGSPTQAMAQLQAVAVAQAKHSSQLLASSVAPRATARLVLGLPVAALLLGQLLGLGSIAVLFETPIALFSFLFGLLLLTSAHFWSARIMQKAAKVETDFNLLLDAIALCLDAGMSFEAATKLSIEAFGSHQTLPEEILKQVQEAQTLSIQTGAATAEILREQASDNRSSFNFRQLEKAEAVSIKLLLPLGILVLPAFALIAVVPLAISLLTER